MFTFPAIHDRRAFSDEQLSSMFDLTGIAPGTDRYLRMQAVRYIALGGEFPEACVLEYMKTAPYPRDRGQRMFPGAGVTVYTREQADRCARLFQAIGF